MGIPDFTELHVGENALPLVWYHIYLNSYHSFISLFNRFMYQEIEIPRILKVCQEQSEKRKIILTELFQYLSGSILFLTLLQTIWLFFYRIPFFCWNLQWLLRINIRRLSISWRTTVFLMCLRKYSPSLRMMGFWCVYHFTQSWLVVLLLLSTLILSSHPFYWSSHYLDRDWCVSWHRCCVRLWYWWTHP